MSGHTPGPWGLLRRSTRNNYIIQGPNGIGELARLIGKSDEAEANARLIAAAPTMLDALHDAKRDLENHEHETGVTPPALIAVRAAIAVATTR